MFDQMKLWTFNFDIVAMYLQVTIIIMSVLMLTVEVSSDPCTSYTELDEYRRSTGYPKDSAPICDSVIKEGWYRSVSKAGSDMPTTSVPFQRCGTTYPLWIDDTLPVGNATKTVKVCLSHFLSNCYSTFNIQVKNCGSFNVYELKQTSGCSQAYCFGNEVPCPDGQSSDNGFTPGCGTYPNVSLTTVVNSDLTDGQYNSSNVIHKIIQFECKITSTIDNAEAYDFDIVWNIDSSQVASFDRISYNNLSQAILTEDKWVGKYTMGFNVKCGIRIRFKGGGSPSPYVYSPFLYAGFKADKSEIVLKEGESTLVNIELTVPLGCLSLRTEADGLCNLFIRVREPTYQKEECNNGITLDNIVFSNDNCGVTFYHSNWNQIKTVNVTGKADNTYNSENRVTFIRLRADNTLEHEAWSFATIPDIKVYVADEEAITLNKLCRSYNDPHMTTFDGRNWENQRAGEFILYKHDAYPIWVHAAYSACPGPWGSATCNCGVAIRYDQAVFEANFCGNISRHYVRGYPKNQYIERNFCDDKHMKVVSSGDTYTITLPTATQVIFRHGDVYGDHGIHHIQIKPSVLDIKSSVGLCGYFDDSTSNEFKLRNGQFTQVIADFANDWRVDTAKGDISLFGRTDFNETGVPLRQYCVCRGEFEDSGIICNLTSTIATCIDDKKTSSNSFFSSCGSGRSKRSVPDRYKRSTNVETNSGAIDKIPLVYSDDFRTEPQVATWRNGWTEESALAYCGAYLRNNPLVIKCGEAVPGYQTTVNTSIDACAQDIKLVGDTRFNVTTLTELTQGCLVEAVRLENLTKTASTSGNSSKTFLDDILDISCVSNCSGNGICNSGKCECINGYEGDYCNMKQEFPPIISNSTNTGHCKTDLRACDEFFISGSNFIAANLTCKARLFYIKDNNTYEYQNKDSVFPGNYINDIGCSCVVPSTIRRKRDTSADVIIAKGYYISVSNDGERFSDEVTFISYDSTCYACDTTAISCLKLNTCPTPTTTTERTTTTTTPTTTTLPTTKEETTTTTTSPTTTTTSPTTTTTSPTTTTTSPTTTTTSPKTTTTSPTTTTTLPTTTSPTTTTTSPTTTTTSPTTTTTWPTTKTTWPTTTTSSPTTTTTSPTTTTSSPTTTTTLPTTTTTSPTTTPSSPKTTTTSTTTTTSPTTTTTSPTTTTTSPTTTTSWPKTTTTSPTTTTMPTSTQLVTTSSTTTFMTTIVSAKTGAVVDNIENTIER